MKLSTFRTLCLGNNLKLGPLSDQKTKPSKIKNKKTLKAPKSRKRFNSKKPKAKTANKKEVVENPTKDEKTPIVSPSKKESILCELIINLEFFSDKKGKNLFRDIEVVQNICDTYIKDKNIKVEVLPIKLMAGEIVLNNYFQTYPKIFCLVHFNKEMVKHPLKADKKLKETMTINYLNSSVEREAKKHLGFISASIPNKNTK